MTRLLYQADAYQKSVHTAVERCTQDAEGHAVILAETVLYPEGGGQPSDHGTLAGQPVTGLSVDDEGKVAHRVEKPVSGTVEVILDWARRYDHMQQHTAQHLITAVACDLFSWNTTAFHLGEERSDIELDCPGLAPDKIKALEERVNHHIRQGLPVTHGFVNHDQVDRDKVRSRGLPRDFIGPVRLVEIEGVDLNTCGGTHVANTTELQMIKLLHTEHLRGGTRLFFLAGHRVATRMDSMVERERLLTALLSAGRDQHLEMVEKLLADARTLEREKRRLRQELAKTIGRDLAEGDRPASFHDPEADMEFLRAIAQAAQQHAPEVLALLTAGSGTGVFLLVGPEEAVKRLGPEVAGLLHGRGGGKGGIFQGKCGRLDSLEDAVNLLR